MALIATPVHVRVPATSANIGPGFDAFGLALAHHDLVEARVAGDDVRVEVVGEGAGELPKYANDPAVEIVHSERGFGIPRALWNFMNSSGTVYENGRFVPNQRLFDWLFVLGYPTTPAFWMS